MIRSSAEGVHVLGDGNGWTRCAQGHRHWGIHGAAGLLLRAGATGGPADGRPASVLMQHRASWTSDGDTWALPGGARDSYESAVQAALREAGEEAGIDSSAVLVTGEFVDDHGGWAYTTVIAEAVLTVTVVANAESAELRWVPEDEVDRLDLHSGFARSWPTLFRGRGNR